MPAEQRDQALMEAIDGYLALHREGRAPSVSNWAMLHGDLGSELRELLPSLIDLEISIETGTDVRRLPQRFGDCLVVRELGRGGMGVVYEGVQEGLKRPVAIKVLSNASSDGTARERFLREARLAASLQHPNIVPIHAVGTHEGIPYLVMHLVDGKPLISLIGGAARNVAPRERQRRAVEMILPAARALAFAHAKGIWHRDIKPANLMRGSDGSVWLTDFGLAHAAGSDRLTGTGMLSGTLAYLAPERFSGAEDARSDLYALGLTLLELASATFAFNEKTPNELVKRILLSGPPKPLEHDRELDPVLARIIARAIAAKPDDRFADVNAFADALETWRNGGIPLLPRTAKPRPTWLMPVLVAAGIVLLAIVLRPGSTPPAATTPTVKPVPEPEPVAETATVSESRPSALGVKMPTGPVEPVAKPEPPPATIAADPEPQPGVPSTPAVPQPEPVREPDPLPVATKPRSEPAAVTPAKATAPAPLPPPPDATGWKPGDPLPGMPPPGTPPPPRPGERGAPPPGAGGPGGPPPGGAGGGQRRPR